MKKMNDTVEICLVFIAISIVVFLLTLIPTGPGGAVYEPKKEKIPSKKVTQKNEKQETKTVGIEHLLKNIYPPIKKWNDPTMDYEVGGPIYLNDGTRSFGDVERADGRYYINSEDVTDKYPWLREKKDKDK